MRVEMDLNGEIWIMSGDQPVAQVCPEQWSGVECFSEIQEMIHFRESCGGGIAACMRLNARLTERVEELREVLAPFANRCAEKAQGTKYSALTDSQWRRALETYQECPGGDMCGCHPRSDAIDAAMKGGDAPCPSTVYRSPGCNDAPAPTGQSGAGASEDLRMPIFTPSPARNGTGDKTLNAKIRTEDGVQKVRCPDCGVTTIFDECEVVASFICWKCNSNIEVKNV